MSFCSINAFNMTHNMDQVCSPMEFVAGAFQNNGSLPWSIVSEIASDVLKKVPESGLPNVVVIGFGFLYGVLNSIREEAFGSDPLCVMGIKNAAKEFLIGVGLTLATSYIAEKMLDQILPSLDTDNKKICNFIVLSIASGAAIRGVHQLIKNVWQSHRRMLRREVIQATVRNGGTFTANLGDRVFISQTPHFRQGNSTRLNHCRFSTSRR